MASHKSHHYVPKFLLEEWHTGRDKKLTYFRWEQGRLVNHRRSAKSVAKLDHLYSTQRHLPEPDVTVERKVMGPKVDDPASLVHKKLIAGGVNQLTNQEQENWSRFLLSLLHRSPGKIWELRERGKQKLLEGIESENQGAVPPEDEPLLTLQQWIEKHQPSVFEDLGVLALESVINSEVLNPKLLSAYWATRQTETAPFDLLVSDKPLTLIGPLGGSFLLVLPISPKMAFFAFSDPATGKTVAERSANEFVRGVNFETVQRADRYVYATDGQQETFISRNLRQ